MIQLDKHLGLFVTLLASLGTASCAASSVKPTPPHQASWITRSVPECGLVADFPVAPKRSEQTTDEGKKVVSLGVDLPNDKGSMVLGCAELGSTDETPHAVLDQLREATLASIDGKLVQEREVFGGRELVFEARGERGVARLLVARNTLASSIVVPVRGFGQENVDHFLTSVRLAPKD